MESSDIIDSILMNDMDAMSSLFLGDDTAMKRESYVTQQSSMARQQPLQDNFSSQMFDLPPQYSLGHENGVSSGSQHNHSSSDILQGFLQEYDQSSQGQQTDPTLAPLLLGTVSPPPTTWESTTLSSPVIPTDMRRLGTSERFGNNGGLTDKYQRSPQRPPSTTPQQHGSPQSSTFVSSPLSTPVVTGLNPQKLVTSHFGGGDGKVVMVMLLRAKEHCKLQLERCLRKLLICIEERINLWASTLLLPYPGSSKYVVVLHHHSRSQLLQLLGSKEDQEITKLVAERDSLLKSPASYQIENGSSVSVEPTSGTSKSIHEFSREIEGVDEEVYNQETECKNDSCHNPRGLQVEAAFVTQNEGESLFHSRYLRNNKKGGNKNLRCFPDCRGGVHVNSGFCGDSIKVYVSSSRVTVNGGIRLCGLRSSESTAMLAFARFIPEDVSTMDEAELLEISGPIIRSGQTLKQEDIDKHKRDKDHPLRPWVQGVFKGSGGDGAMQLGLFEFNSDLKAWHYGWSAPRGQGSQGDVLHCIEILLFKPFNKRFYCVHTLKSESFAVGSSRRPTASGSSGAVESISNSTPTADDEDEPGFFPTSKKRKATSKVISAADVLKFDLNW